MDFWIPRILKDYEIIGNDGLQDCEDFEGLQNNLEQQTLGLQGFQGITKYFK